MRNYYNENDFIGRKIGKITIVEYLGSIKKETGDYHRFWLGKCQCGKNIYLRQTDIIKEVRKSCHKCDKSSYKHGMTNTRLFRIWQNIRGRCYCKTNVDYKDYGARGIKMDEEWRDNFINFYNWAINNGYKDNLSIDRIDVNGNYEPSNCRWANNYTQANNKRNNKRYEYNGKLYTIRELSNMSNLSYSIIQSRIYSGWSIEKAISIPPVIGRNQYS